VLVIMDRIMAGIVMAAGRPGQDAGVSPLLAAMSDR